MICERLRKGMVGTAGAALLAVALASCSGGPSQGSAALPPAPAGSATPASSAPSTSAEADGRCRLDDVAVEKADGEYRAGRNQVRVVWANSSGRPCTIDGFGGVDLVDSQGKRLSAARTDQTPSKVTLEPGGKAHSTLSYPAAGGTGVFTPTTILATLPNETRSAEVPWGSGGVPTFESPGSDELQISPVQPNAS